MRKIFLYQILSFIAVLLSLGLQAQQTSLRNIVDDAMQRNLQIQQQQYRVMQADAVNKSGIGWFLPKVDVVGGYTWFNQDMEVNMGIVKPALDNVAGVYGASIAKDLGLTPGTQDEIQQKITQSLGKLPNDNIAFDFNQFPNASILAVQPLFMGGKIISAKNSASITTNISQLHMTATKNVVTKKIVDEYYMVVLLQSVVELRQLLVKDIEKHTNNIKRMIESGVLPKYIMLRAEVTLASAERELEDEKMRLEIAQSALNVSAGYPEDTTLVLADSLYFKMQNLSVEDLESRAKSDLPVYQLIEHKRQLVEENYNSQRANMMPHVFAFANYSFFNNYLPIVMAPFTAGVQLKFNIFNGGSDYKKLQASKFMLQESQLNAEEAEVKVNFTIEKAYKQMESAKKRYLKLNSTIEMAKENYRISKKRFEQGIGNSVDVLDAFSLLETAQIEQLFSLYAYYVAINNLYFASGQGQKIVDILE
jgi:outer membrane protein TolC